MCIRDRIGGASSGSGGKRTSMRRRNHSYGGLNHVRYISNQIRSDTQQLYSKRADIENKINNINLNLQNLRQNNAAGFTSSIVVVRHLISGLDDRIKKLKKTCNVKNQNLDTTMTTTTNIEQKKTYLSFFSSFQALHTKTSFSTWFSDCLLYTSPSPRDGLLSRMPSSA
eukprot:TRINITY_DN20564_c0_g1_i1.p1 TRINITY_DN20564_c0_g1~~TRINITY_DN20564_c0_g1_i1.p1  ORF type:complete len:169 (-),score=26.42 TRINITY_DN20564_c0_g1_i1:11-517(-)